MDIRGISNPLLYFVAPNLFLFAFVSFLGGGGTLAAYGGSQARGPIGSVAAGLHHGYSNTGLELRLRPQLMAMLDEARSRTCDLMDASQIFFC